MVKELSLGLLSYSDASCERLWGVSNKYAKIPST
jgi:hypothetical protein